MTASSERRGTVATLAAIAVASTMLATPIDDAFAQDASRPVFTIKVDVPGAMPEDVERDVTIPIEQAVNAIAGVRRIRSNSREGESSTSVEFRNIAEAVPKADAIRAAIDRLRSRWPDADRPVYGWTTRPEPD